MAGILLKFDNLETKSETTKLTSPLPYSAPLVVTQDRSPFQMERSNSLRFTVTNLGSLENRRKFPVNICRMRPMLFLLPACPFYHGRQAGTLTSRTQ